MTADLRIALPANSFKPEFAAGPSGFRTPSPPADALEPLTPPPWPLSHPQHLLSSRKKRRLQEPLNYRHRLPPSASISHPTPPGSVSTALPLQKPRETPPNGSATSHPSRPSPTALDVFAAVATSPSLSQPTFSPSLSEQRPASSQYGTSGLAGRSQSQNVPETFYYESSRPQSSRHLLSSTRHTRYPKVEDAELLLNFSRTATNYRQHWQVPGKAIHRANYSNIRHPDYYPNADNTSPAMNAWPLKESPEAQKKPRVHKGWPKGKPRGKRTANATTQAQVKKSTQRKPGRPGRPPQRTKQPRTQKQNHQQTSAFSISFDDLTLPPRPKSATACESFSPSSSSAADVIQTNLRCASVPLNIPMIPPVPKSQKSQGKPEPKLSICSVCDSSIHPNGIHDLWIICNGCKKWFHTICVGFKNEREVRDVDKFYCSTCEPQHGKTTFVRKSSRAHVAVDYAGLNEGQIRAPPDSFEHHFIKPIKDGTINLCPENFPRMAPELVTAEFFQKSGTIAEPIVIPAALNCRPWASESPLGEAHVSDSMPRLSESFGPTFESDAFTDIETMEWDCVHDDGQDQLDMVMPKNLTVRLVAEILGPERPLQVIDTKSQDSGDNTWSLGKWADYYEAAGEKPVRNVISLEVSQTKLSRLIRRPKVVRDLDLTDQVWPREELEAGTYPHVQYYCLMSVADCFTDFHIDFGGSSVFYHILRGKKTFFFIPPKKQHLKKYEEWCISPSQASIWLGDETKECYRVDLSEGDTMLIPSGWIHAVWTPETSLVIGGNFLTRMHYGMQLQVNEIEKNTGVAKMFRYPSFQRVHWYAVLQYLQDDPVPASVAQILYEGGKFPRSVPVFLEDEDNGDENPEYFNARYYSQGEMQGLGDVLAFIFRTVMIAIGRIPLPKPKQEVVIRSMPKGYGEYLDILKTFAIWVAWKRGNETLPTWAHDHAPLSELDIAMAEKKPGAPTGNAVGENGKQPKRRGPKRKEKEVETRETTASVNEAEATSDPNADSSNSFYWCRSCKRDRKFCPHRDPTHDVDIYPRFGVKTIVSKPPVSPIDSEIHMRNVEDPPTEQLSSENTQIWPGVDIDPHSGHLTPPSMNSESHASMAVSNARIKACEECRKSKRRCVHDASGNIDPIKAMQNPVPRAFSATKRMRQEKVVNGMPQGKRIKTSPMEGEEWPSPGFATGPLQSHAERSTSSTDVVEGHNTMTVEPPSDLHDFTSTISPPQLNNVSASNETFEGIHGVSKAVQKPSRDNFSGEHGAFSEPEALNRSAECRNVPAAPLDEDTNHGLLLLKDGSEAYFEGFAPETIDAKSKVRSGPNEHSETETRSISPSIRIQTTSTDSMERSASSPATPLSDLDRDSPASAAKLDKSPQTETNGERLSCRENDAPVFSNPSPEASSAGNGASRMHRKSNKPDQLPSEKSKGKSARNWSVKRDSAPEVSPQEQFPTPLFTAISQAPIMKLEAISPTEETQEEESLRLARELQEQEFGLRRRRSSKT